MQRVLIIGSAGAGKSTLSRTLGAITRLPVIHLDAEFWQANWKETPREIWKQRVNELMRREQWIMDGNYGGTMSERMSAADTIILLALPRIQCLLRVMRRSIQGYGKARGDLHPECKEQLPDWEFIRWIWTYPRLRLPGILEKLAAFESTKTVIVLRTSSEVREYLKAVSSVLRTSPEML